MYYEENKRTKQQMPHYIQFYNDFLAHEALLQIERAAKKCTIPCLIIHGDADQAVSIEEAKKLHAWSSNSIYKCIEGGNHVFGVKQPWEVSEMPPDLIKVWAEILDFINN